MFRTLPLYEETDLGLPYPITLNDGVEEEIDDETGERVGVSIPALEQLAAAVAVARALNPLQLDGREVRFIRRVIGMPAKDLAEALEMDAATLSRWENNKHPVGAWADKQVRMAAVIMLRDRVPHISLNPADVVTLRVRSRQGDQWPTIRMVLTRRQSDACTDEPREWDTMKLAA